MLYKKISRIVYAKIENSNLFVAEGMKQGEFSLLHTEVHRKVRGLLHHEYNTALD